VWIVRAPTSPASSTWASTPTKPTIPALVGHPCYVNWWECGSAAVRSASTADSLHRAQKSKRDTLQPTSRTMPTTGPTRTRSSSAAPVHHGRGNWNGGILPGLRQLRLSPPVQLELHPRDLQRRLVSCTTLVHRALRHSVPFYNLKTSATRLNVRESEGSASSSTISGGLRPRHPSTSGCAYDNMTADYGGGQDLRELRQRRRHHKPVVLRDTAAFDVYDFTNWSPRLGIAWDLTATTGPSCGRTWDGYYAPLSVEALRRLARHGTYTEENWIYWFRTMRSTRTATTGSTPTRWCGRPASFTAWSLPTCIRRGIGCLVAVDRCRTCTSSPYTDQFNISLQHQLAKDLASSSATSTRSPRTTWSSSRTTWRPARPSSGSPFRTQPGPAMRRGLVDRR